jgi:hypothetical protein
MQRVFGALAAFGGWVCLLASGAAGLLATESLGLSHTEGSLPRSSVYGIPEVVVLWILLGVALLALIPVGAAMAMERPSGLLFLTGAAMAAVGLALLPDELGRVHSLTILPGAAAFAASGYLLMQAEPDQTRAEASAGSPGGEDLDPAAMPPSPQTHASPGPAAAAAPAAVAAPASTGQTSTRPRGRRGSPHACPWCSAEYRGKAAACPACGAALEEPPGVAEEAIPGVTVVSPRLREYEYRAAHPAKKRRASLLSMMMGGDDDRLVDPAVATAFEGATDAYRPPSDELRQEMDRIQLEIAAAHEAALRQTGAESQAAGASDAAGPPLG